MRDVAGIAAQIVYAAQVGGFNGGSIPLGDGVVSFTARITHAGMNDVRRREAIRVRNEMISQG